MSPRPPPALAGPARLTSPQVRAVFGLPAVDVLGVERDAEKVTIEIQLRRDRPVCLGCERLATIKDTDVVELVDLPCFDRRSRLRWRKRRWQCRHATCPMRSWTETAPEIAASWLLLTDRAGRWVCEQVGRLVDPHPRSYLSP